jgi:hypothetical protein
MMNIATGSPFLLSLMSTVCFVNVGLVATAAGLAVLGCLHLLNPYLVLVSVFLIGVGFAFDAASSTSIVPQVVSDAELPSAATLSGLQFNISGIIGPMLVGFLVPLAGANFVFALNAACFLLAVQATHQWKQPPVPAKLPHGEPLRIFQDGYPLFRFAPGFQVVLARNFRFALFISVIPALMPVVGSVRRISVSCSPAWELDRWSARCSSFRRCELACNSLIRQRWNTARSCQIFSHGAFL